MYLPDFELQKRLDEFAIETEMGLDAFDSDAQVGPASIDLRLSRTFWRPQPGLRLRRARTVDLSQVATREIKPTRGWRQVTLKGSRDKLVLRPGQVVLARTAEQFSIPNDCAGALEGRSSYARLGLSIHTTGGFVNPGWTGRMPLTLHNQGPFTIKMVAGLPICQLMLVKLTGEVERSYAEREGRKYQNDYGGPSVWWRDDVVKKILARPDGGALSDAVLGELDELLDRAEVSDDALERFEDFVDRRRLRDLSTTSDLLDQFATQEDRRFWGSRAARYLTPVLAATLGTATVRAISDGLNPGDLVLGGATLLSTVAAVYFNVAARLTYLTTDKLRHARSES